jgi:cation diffusion facilitator CzcD-associated flavoprotein CzcO
VRAAQVIPELAEIASQLTVFQRTPPWMLPKDDRPFDDDERHRYRNESAAVQQERERLWTEQHVNTALRADDPRVADRQQLAKTFLDAQVADPLLREALTPDYPFRCKRVLLGANYYAVLQLEHVELVTIPSPGSTGAG